VSGTSKYLGENPGTEVLVGKAKEGSQTAWREIHRRYRTMLVAQVQARIPGFARRRFDADDVLQEALLKVVQDIHAFEYRGEGSFRCWLATLVVNTFRNELRKQRAEHEKHPETAVRPEHEHEAGKRSCEIDERKASMLEALGQMTDEERDILIQRHFEERTFDDIASILGCKREMARQKYSLAFERLQKRLRA